MPTAEAIWGNVDVVFINARLGNVFVLNRVWPGFCRFTGLLKKPVIPKLAQASACALFETNWDANQ